MIASLAAAPSYASSTTEDFASLASEMGVVVGVDEEIVDAGFDEAGGSYLVVADRSAAEPELVALGEQVQHTTGEGTTITTGVSASCTQSIKTDPPYKLNNKVHGKITYKKSADCGKRTVCQDLGEKIGIWFPKGECTTLGASIVSGTLYMASTTCNSGTSTTWGNSGVWGSETLPVFVTKSLACRT
ncbi:hypothetical protein ACIG47_00565 [Promicromonospora sp. NPDC052451]|uniref:hypothetical protein n=1 Tax=Promicromonospora sp. NPDC052451 TaxID=3364407 RepID=UPI0037C69A1A